MVAFSQEIADEICSVISCTSLGIRRLRKKKEHKHWPNPATVFDWRKKYPKFNEQYTLAKVHQAQVLADEVLEIADNSRKDFMIVDGQIKANSEHINRSRLRIDTRKWLLSKVLPKIYGDKIIEDKTTTDTLLEKLIDKL